MKPIEQPKFRFRKHSDIGASDAESDDKFLKQCFVDNGDIAELLDVSSLKRIIVGRTGSGKSALISEQVKGEVIHNAQKIVSEVQIKDLGKVIDLLADDIFDENKYPYYITIDKLDDNWANDRIRYKLIRALLETLRTFQRIPGVKIIVALRVDLLERVFEKTRNLGFQEDKYEPLYLSLRWSESQLKSLIDKRLDFLIKQQYTTKQVRVDDIFPNKVNGQSAFEYMCARTFGRPRDIILFVNACLELVEGKSSIPAASVKEAESEYSKKRLRSLADEWHADYPNLIGYAQIFLSRKSSFKFSEISSDDTDKFVLDHCCDFSADDPIYKLAAELNEGKRSHNAFLIGLVKILYRVGIVGIKPDTFNQTQWSFNEKASVTDGQIKKGATIQIHPMFWRALGVVPPSRNIRGD